MAKPLTARQVPEVSLSDLMPKLTSPTQSRPSSSLSGLAVRHGELAQSLVELFLAAEPQRDATEAVIEDSEVWSGLCTVNREAEDEDSNEKEGSKRDKNQAAAEQRAQEGSLSDLFAGLRDPSASWEWKRWRMAKWVESDVAKGTGAVLVCLNALTIGVSADNDPTAPGWMALEVFFVLVFTGELLVKLCVFRLLFWTDTWNLIDFVIVGLSDVDLFISLVLGEESSGLSVLRLLRVARILRIISFVERLNLLVEAFVRAMRSVFWVGVLMVLVIYIFAILAQGFFGQSQDLQKQKPDAAYAFRSIPSSIQSLFQIVTLDDWVGDYARPIGEVFPLAWIFFFTFILLVSLGLLNLLTGVFIKALLDITEENKEMEMARLRKVKKKLLKVISALFTEYDSDKSGTLSRSEADAMLNAAEEYHHLLEQVGLPAEKLRLACNIADHTNMGRLYDPNTRTMYNQEFQPPPADVPQHSLVQDEAIFAYGNTVPDGVLEGELLECLFTMDQDVMRSDVFAVSKSVRLMHSRLCNVEKEMAGMRTDVRSILGMLAGGNAHGKRSIDQLQRWGQGRGELSNSYDEYEDDDDKDEEDEDDEDYEEAKARGENARGRAEGVIAARSEPASRTSSPKLGGQAGADRKEMRASSEGGRVVDGRVFMDLAWKIFERYDVDESATINSEEELKQMCLNLLYKLKLPPGGLNLAQVDNLHAISTQGLEFDEFVEWFLQTFDIGVKGPRIRSSSDEVTEGSC